MVSHLLYYNLWPFHRREPSALLVVGNFGGESGFINYVHLLPDGKIQSAGMSSSEPTFRRRGSREKTREQIGTISIHEGESVSSKGSYLDEVYRRLRDQLGGGSQSSSPEKQQQTQTETETETETNSDKLKRLVEDVLRPVALDALHERGERKFATDVKKTYP
ncbi:hypothetical protein KEM55_008118, partial [Ascosphaera atra]